MCFTIDGDAANQGYAPLQQTEPEPKPKVDAADAYVANSLDALFSQEVLPSGATASKRMIQSAIQLPARRTAKWRAACRGVSRLPYGARFVVGDAHENVLPQSRLAVGGKHENALSQ